MNISRAGDSPRLDRHARKTAAARPAPAAVTTAVTRGVARWLDDMGIASLTEFKLGNGRRADVVGLNAAGTILMVEVKSTPEDFRGDAKWLDYVPYCDGFTFAVPPQFPSLKLSFFRRFNAAFGEFHAERGHKYMPSAIDQYLRKDRLAQDRRSIGKNLAGKLKTRKGLAVMAARS